MTLRPWTWIAIGLAALAVVIFLCLDPGVDAVAVEPRPLATASAEPSEPENAPEALAGSLESPPSGERAPIAIPAALETRAAAVPPTPETPLRVHGLVLDLQGTPVEDVEVGVAEHGERARTDTHGHFELVVPRSSLGSELEVVAERLVALRTALVAENDPELRVVVCPSLSLSGWTIDATGTALPETQVEASFVEDPLEGFPSDLGALPVRFRATSNAMGTFRIEVPALSGALVATLPRHSVARAVLPESDRNDVELVLQPLEPGWHVSGAVLTHDRTPAAGAWVYLGRERTPVGDDGRFLLAIEEDLAPDAVLAAGLEGHAPIVRERFGEIALAARPGSPAPVELVLGQNLMICGRVTDSSGALVEGWLVSLVDGTPVRTFPNRVFAEDLPQDFSREVESAVGSGSFCLGSLLARSYVLRAHDPRTLLEIESAPIPSGTRDALLHVGDDLLHPRVVGHVRSRRGTLVGAVLVLVVRDRANGDSLAIAHGMAETDELGRFELADVPRSGVRFLLDGASILPTEFDPNRPEYDPEALQIEVARRAHFRVKVHGAAQHSGRLAIEIHDAAGASVPIHRPEGSPLPSIGHDAETERYRIPSLSTARLAGLLPADGVSEILCVQEDVFELVVRSNDVVLARRPLALDPDLEVNEIDVDLDAHAVPR